MKATLEFTLPEEQIDHRHAVNGSKYMYVLSELDERLRSKIKYASDVSDPQVLEGLSMARTILHDILDEEGVNLHD